MIGYRHFIPLIVSILILGFIIVGLRSSILLEHDNNTIISQGENQIIIHNNRILKLVYTLRPIINSDVKSYSGDIIPLTKTYVYSEPVWNSVFGDEPRFQIYIGAMDGYATIYSSGVKLLVEKLSDDKYNLSLILVNSTIIIANVGYRIYNEANYSLGDVLSRLIFIGKLYETSAPKPFSSIKAYKEIMITVTININTTSNEYFIGKVILGSWIFEYSGKPIIYVVPNTHYSIVRNAMSLTGLDIEGIISCFITSNTINNYTFMYEYNGVEREISPDKIVIYRATPLNTGLINSLTSSHIIDEALWIHGNGFNESILVINNTYYVGAPKGFPPITLLYDRESEILVAVNPDQSILGEGVPGTIFSYLIPQVFNAYLGVNTRFFIEPVPPYNWASLILVEASTQ